MAEYIGTSSNDTLSGTTASDVLAGLAGNDALHALDGNDTLDGGPGNDSLYGGFGWDTATYADSPSPVLVNLQTHSATGAGEDYLESIEHVIASDFNDTLVAHVGSLSAQLDGGAGNDSLVGGAYDDNLVGGDGNDTIFGSSGADTIQAEAGVDTIVFAGPREDYFVAVDAQGTYSVTFLPYDETDTIRAPEVFQFDDDTLPAADAVSPGGEAPTNGTPADDWLYGTSSGDSFDGREGHDTLFAGAGNDTLVGGAGNDSLWGEAGWDTCVFTGTSSEYSIVWQPWGVELFLVADSVAGRDGSDWVKGVETLVFADGSIATATFMGVVVHGGSGNDRLEGTQNSDVLHGEGGDDHVTAGAGADSIDGGDGHDTLIGGAGNDFLLGLAGRDWLEGGSGDDLLWPEAAENGSIAHELVDGGDGFDVAWYDKTPGPIDVDLAAGFAWGACGNDTLLGIEGIVGPGFGSRLSGSTANESLSGGAGNDTVSGGAGDDSLSGAQGIDTLSYAASPGAVTVNLFLSKASGAAGNDTLYSFEQVVGSAFDDVIHGTSGTEVLQGGSGNDTLNAMNGEDTLDGGNGHDLFLVTQGSQRVLGGPDIDTVAYNYPASGFAVDRDGVIGLGPLAGSSDHLENVERARFAFSAVAFDLEGNAGNAARMVGAVLGPQALGSASIADLALDLYDSGLSNADVAQLAVDGLFAGHSDEAFIGSLFRNILHVDPSATQLTSLVNLLAQTTRSDLLVRAASSAENESSIGFAGLEAAGWWYIL